MSIIIVVFFILSLIVSLMLIKSNINWIFKTLLTIFCLIFCISTYNSIDNFDGLATMNQLPNKFLLHSTLIYKDKYIYLWVTDIEEKSSFMEISPFNEPKAYKIVYNEKLSKELLQNVIPKLKKGTIVIGEKTSENYDELFNINDSLTDSFSFYDLPPPVMPSKN